MKYRIERNKRGLTNIMVNRGSFWVYSFNATARWKYTEAKWVALSTFANESAANSALEKIRANENPAPLVITVSRLSD